MSGWRKVGCGLRVPCLHLGSGIGDEVTAGEVVGPPGDSCPQDHMVGPGGRGLRSPRGPGSRGGCRQHVGLPGGAVSSQGPQEGKKEKEGEPRISFPRCQLSAASLQVFVARVKLRVETLPE